MSEGYKPEYMAQYRKKTVDSITVTVPKGYKAKIKEFAKKYDISMNGFIVRAIERSISEEERVGEDRPIIMEYDDGDFRVEIRKK